MQQDFKVIIPARLGSGRLEGKLLKDIGGIPLIEHTYHRAQESGASSIVIATDNQEIADTCLSFGAKVCMTSPDHPSGTDRLGEAVTALGYEDDQIVVNVQGDEAFLPPSVIRQVADDLKVHDNTKLATVAARIQSTDELFDPSVVKVVMNHRGFALYFSRAPIPWEREAFQKKPAEMHGEHYRHVGIYAYRAGFLVKYLEWGQSPIGAMESLEQLRVLWHAGRIHVCITEEDMTQGVDINTPEDLEAARNYYDKVWSKKNRSGS